MKILDKAVSCIFHSWRSKLKISENIITQSFLSFQVSWQKAKDFCHQTGGRLASVEDNNFVRIIGYTTTRNKNQDIWLGGNFHNLLGLGQIMKTLRILTSFGQWRKMIELRCFGHKNIHLYLGFRDKKTPTGCLSMDKKGPFFFQVSECFEIKSPLCYKAKGVIIPSVPKCGPNTFMDAKGLCYCLINYFESKPGDANSTVGCVTPCESDPCPNSSTYCQAWTAEKFKCICIDNLVPKNGNAKLHGCEEKRKIE